MIDLGLLVEVSRDTADVNYRCYTTTYTCMSDMPANVESCMDHDICPVVPPGLHLHVGAFCSGCHCVSRRCGPWCTRTVLYILESDQHMGVREGARIVHNDSPLFDRD